MKYIFHEKDCSFDYLAPQGVATITDFLPTGFNFDDETGKIEGIGELENLFYERNYEDPIQNLCNFLASAIYWGNITIEDVARMRQDTGIFDTSKELLIEKIAADIEAREAAANLMYKMEREENVC